LSDNDIYREDARLYRKLIALSQKQLAAIHIRLKADTGKMENFRFWNRNRRIKKSILSILEKKQVRIGGDAPREIMDDLKRIEMNEKDWPNVKKDELDYVHIMLHGLIDLSEFEGSEQVEQP